MTSFKPEDYNISLHGRFVSFCLLVCDDIHVSWWWKERDRTLELLLNLITHSSGVWRRVRGCVWGGVMSVAGVNPSSHLVTVHTHVHTYSQFTSFFFLSFHLVSFSPLSYGPSLSPSLIIPSLLHSPPHVLLPVLASLLFPPLLALPPSFLFFSEHTRFNVTRRQNGGRWWGRRAGDGGLWLDKSRSSRPTHVTQHPCSMWVCVWMLKM